MTINQDVEGNDNPATDLIISENSSEYSEDESSEEKESREDSRFKEGQILRFVRVRFPGNSRSFAFLLGKRTLEYGQKVVAMSDRGMAVGYVNSFPYDLPFHKSMLPIRSISKVASDDDIIQDKEAHRKQKDAENTCNDLIEQHKLDMHLTHVEFTSFGKKAVFYFIAPSRVDFRDLVRDLVHKLKTRIELRQISVRDRSASVGGIGPCGRELCCSSFLTKYGNVGIKMAKNQDLTLNFSKLNGVCGQLKCCLQYEDEVYKEKRSHLPRENDIITTHTGETGKVLRIHILEEQFEILTTRGVKKRFVAELYKESLNKEEANFPKEFEGITDETHKVVGLEEAREKAEAQLAADLKAATTAGKDFAEKTFEALFGEKTLGISLPEVAEPDNGRRKIVVPEEEEEINYTPSSEDLLEEDDEEDDYLMDDEPIQTRTPVSTEPTRAGSEMGSRGQRPQQSQNRDHRGPRDGNRQGQSGSRNDGGQRRDNRDNRGPRQEGGRRDGGPRQGQNQNRSEGGPRRDNRGDNRGRNDGGQRPQNNNNNNNNRNRPPRQS